jgi:hypothetical protein
MRNADFRWRNRSFYDLRRDPAVIRELERRGRQIVNAANATLPEKRGYRMSSFQGKRKSQGRWFVQVYAASRHAKYSDRKHNTLVRVLNSTQSPSPVATRAE